ncbi:MAG: SPW repeat protein [Acidobacteriaceae bacterium]
MSKNTLSGIIILAGIWLIIAPFVLGFRAFGVSPTNDVIVGILAIIFGGVRMMSDDRMTWPSWLSLLLGIWLIIAPFVLKYSSTSRVVTNDIILGIVVGILGAMSAMTSREVHSPM